MRDDELLHRFLLGELAEDEAESLGLRLLQEDALFELCEAIEGDLLAASARGDLTPEENERVLARLAASPRGRGRLALARDLVEAAKPAPVLLRFRRAVETLPRWAGPFAAVAASLLLVVSLYLRSDPPAPPTSPGAGGQVVNDYPPAAPSSPVPPPTPPAGTIAERPALPQPVPVPERPPVPEPAPRPTAVFQLLATTLRDAEPAEELPRFPVPKGTGEVELQLYLEGVAESDYETFNALVQSLGTGETKWNRQGLKPQPGPETGEGGVSLVLAIPADQLPAGKYEVTIEGVKAEGEAEPIVTPEFEIVTVATD